MTIDFTHLHVHSEFSLLDGMSKVSQLVARAQELGMDSLALTDHGGMYAAVDFYGRCRDAGIKPLIGSEMYLAPRSMRQKEPRVDQSANHLVLLAADRTGYRNLLYLTSQAYLDGFYYKPRIDKELLADHAKGLVALSACGSGEIPRLLAAGNEDAARQAAAWYREVFGPGRFFLELQEHELPDMVAVNRRLVELGRELSIPLVATNDVHYVQESDAPAQEILLCIQTNTTLQDPKHMRMDGTGYHMRTQEEMAVVFGELPEALANTRAVVEQCNLKLDFGRLHLPDYEVPAGETPDSYLATLCWEGLHRRYDPVTPEAEERLRYELDVIQKTGFPIYLLIVRDLAHHARSQGIPFGVRGSAASSIVCYCTGITDIDPLYWQLPFERFLNVERKQMPDIDMDFADNRRAEMITYVTERYGRDHVAQIITFGTLGAKAALRDVGRVLNCDLGYVDRLAKMIPSLPVGITIDKAMAEVAELKSTYENDPQAQHLIDSARRLEGVARHASTHAAGVVISRDPLVNHVPLQRAVKGEDVVMCQYDMNDLEKIGLLKMDFLGLANLTILGRALEIIKSTRGETVDLQAIPQDDAKAFAMLGEGETTAIFQLEGSGMRRYIKELLPTSIADLAAMLALYRPGPMNAIPQYIASKNQQVEVTFLHPLLEPILSPTHGVLVYQDQVLFIARAVAGYSLGQADILRKAMGKKIAEQMRKEKAHFLAGAQEKGVDQQTASDIWDQIEPFSGYGFNKAHAVCYAYIAYQTAFLKANYPAEYMCAVLESASGDMDKVATAIAECRRLSIPVFPPDINRSQSNFAIDEHVADGKAVRAIRYGLAAIKNVGEGPVEEIIAARQHGGPFRGVEDFCRRLGTNSLNKRVLESLIKAGALATLAPRRPLLEILDQLVSVGQYTQHALQVGQSSMFDLLPADDPATMITLPDMPEADYRERLAWEKELLGTYLSEHPLQKVAERLKGHLTCLCGQVDQEMAGQKVVIAGMVAEIRRFPTKNGDTMAFAVLEDVQGKAEVTIFQRTFKKTEPLWEPDRILLVCGKVEVRNDRAQIICDSAEEYDPDQSATVPASNAEAPLPAILTARSGANGNGRRKEAQPPATPAAAPVMVNILFPRTEDEALSRERMRSVDAIIRRHPGNDPFGLYVSGLQGRYRIMLPDRALRYSKELVNEICAILGPGSVEIVPR